MDEFDAASYFQNVGRMLSQAKEERRGSTRELHDDAYFKDRDLTAVDTRNKTYNAFLTAYVENQQIRNRHQRRMKCVFFTVTLVVLFLVVAAMCAAVLLIARKPAIAPADVAAVITAVGGVVASFIVLPKVVAENLFPSREDDKTAEIFNSMITYDMRLKNYYSCPPDEPGPPEPKQP